MKIRDCMQTGVYWLKPNNTVKDCAKIMSKEHIGCVPICDNKEKIVGLVTDRDIILRAIVYKKDVEDTNLSEIMTKDVWYCNSNSDIKEAENIMYKNQIRRLPIVDDNNKITGIITLGDLIKNDNIDDDDVYDILEGIYKYSKKNAE